MNVARMVCEFVDRNEVFARDPMDEEVARTLADKLMQFEEFDPRPEEAITSGVLEAFDEMTYEDVADAVAAVQAAVFDEVEIKAKAIALRLLRELAAKCLEDTAETASA